MSAAEDTIFAMSSGSGRAGVAVVRISGPRADDLLLAVAGAPLPEPRKAALRKLRDPASGEALDRGIVLRFPGAASFTGESSAELHVHGGRAVVRGILGALGGFPGVRLADPGEFARRAFDNGKLDLAQAEALADLIDADTAVQRRQALRESDGALGVVVARWRADLLTVRALIAAEIDFSDEGDVGDRAAAGIDSLLERIAGEMTSVLRGARRSRIIAEGLRVVIVGRPNSGKSTLLNALSGTEAAIVSEHAGTTRDVIAVTMDWDGYPVVLVDTAGLRDTDDPVERIGVARARREAERADVVMHLDEHGDWDAIGIGDGPAELIRVRTKCDLASDEASDAYVPISARTGVGIDALRARVVQVFERLDGRHADAAVVTARQEQALARAVEACRRALSLPPQEIELRDHEVAACTTALEVLIGRIGVEEVLGSVFGRFCVGK
jgi:tRNA modification GTPase